MHMHVTQSDDSLKFSKIPGAERELVFERATMYQLPPDVLVITLTAFMHIYEGALHSFPPRMVCKLWRNTCKHIRASVSLCLREVRRDEFPRAPHSVDCSTAATKKNRMEHLRDKMKRMHKRFPSIVHMAVEKQSKKNLTWSMLSPVISMFQNLTSISFAATEVTDNDILEIAKGCRNINKVCLNMCHIGDAAVDALAMHKKLEYVEIGETQISDGALKALAQCPLQYLDIEKTRVTDKGIKSLGECKSIKTLIISWCKITDESAPDIAFLNDLRTLDIVNCSISHEFIAIVARSCPKISWLILSNLHGDATLEYAIIPYCRNLIEMDLFCCEGDIRFEHEPENECLSIEGLNCLEGGCPLLRNVNFHFRPLPSSSTRNQKLIEAFRSFTNETQKKAKQKALKFDYVAKAYDQFDTDQDVIWRIIAFERTIKL